eukprot:811678-Prymnesium_polylepis.1
MAQGKRIQVLTANGIPLQVISPSGGRRLGGVCLLRRRDLDRSLDPWRLVVVDRAASRLYLLKRASH